ncbi:uncharacterized protein V6R79_021885 [Siganus canaliculatus]
MILPPCSVETLRCRHSSHGYVVLFLLFTTLSKGSTCVAPSSPQCFRRNTAETIYICEWSMNMTESDKTFDLYVNNKKIKTVINTTETDIVEEKLIRNRFVDIWVEAHVGNSSCRSSRNSVTLMNTVKHEAPEKISMSWSNAALILRWKAVEKSPALTEVRLRRHEHPEESWQNVRKMSSLNRVSVLDLKKQTAYQVQIRQLCTQVSNPLWSDWSPVVIVPAELEEKPEVSITTKLLNGTRKVTLKWNSITTAAAVTGVKYRLYNTQSPGCPCKKSEHDIEGTGDTISVSYSTVNITVIAINEAGHSPPTTIHIPPVPAVDLESCHTTLLDKKKMKKGACLELHELQDEDSRSEIGITLSGCMTKKKKNMARKSVKDYVRYLYSEHMCEGRKLRTVKMCQYYQKEGVPHRPQGFTSFSETHSSVNLSWKAIPTVHQRGFLKHYILCSVKISSQQEHRECHNISVSLVNYHLENLTPGSKYNISLAGVTQVGEGEKATVTANTLPEQPMNVLFSFCLMLVFFIISILCTIVVKRIKIKIWPPVPTPVIPNFTPYQSQNKEMQQGREEVDELSLHQLYPEDKPVPEDLEKTSLFRAERDYSTDEDEENDGIDSRMFRDSDDECSSSGSMEGALRREAETIDLEQLDFEIAMLRYSNGLVFDGC